MQTTLLRSRSAQPAAQPAAAKTARAPKSIKLAYTGFMAVLIPVYWSQYGATNFLYFCDVALFLTLAAVWLDSALLASMAAVGILLPQFLWCADFAAHLAGLSITGMTSYMFDPKLPLFLRGLSFFHGWLPFLLLFLVVRGGYDSRGLRVWTFTAWTLMFVSYFLMPRPGALLTNPKAPVNINYVFGLGDDAPQTWMPGWAWFTLLLVAMPVVIYWPTHLVLKRVCRKPAAKTGTMNTKVCGEWRPTWR